MLENTGYGNLRAQVIPQQDWITVNRRDWTIKAAKTSPGQGQLEQCAAKTPRAASRSAAASIRSSRHCIPVTLVGK